MLPETSALTRTTRCNNPEDIRYCLRRENIPEDSALPPYKTSVSIFAATGIRILNASIADFLNAIPTFIAIC
jgi:hypothetical protein